MEPVVSLAAIHRRARAAAAAGHCPHTTCPWPPESAAAQVFHEQFRAQQVQQSAAHKEVPHVHA